MKLLLVVGLVALLAAAAHAFPNGAPAAACVDIFPVRHNASAVPNTANQSVNVQLSSNLPGDMGVQYYYCPETMYTREYKYLY